MPYRDYSGRRVLAAATQVTRRAPGGSVEDHDVVRTPRTMAAYTAAACAGILGQPTDRIPAGVDDELRLTKYALALLPSVLR